MKEQILKTIEELIEIPSVSGDEAEIARVLQYCRDFFLGYDVYFKEFKYENASPVMLISNHQNNDFDVLVVGHLDVVPAGTKMFIPRIEGNKLFGRGSGDMKSQIAVALYTLKYIIENKLPLKYGILITTDEETTSNGIKSLVKNENINPKIVMDYDAGDLLTIIEKYKHSVGVKIFAKGVDGHSSRPWNGINAIEKLINTINLVQSHFGTYSKELPIPENTWVDTMAVTAFTSPVTMNVIPAAAEANLNFRLTEKISLEKLEEILNQACAKNFCSYKVVMASCGCYMDANNQIIQSYRKIAGQLLGQEIKIEHMNGATDARMFADKAVIIMHSPSSYNAHNSGEYIEIDSIFKFLEIQQKFLTKLAEKN